MLMESDQQMNKKYYFKFIFKDFHNAFSNNYFIGENENRKHSK
jgi:hypothetical protein